MTSGVLLCKPQGGLAEHAEAQVVLSQLHEIHAGRYIAGILKSKLPKYKLIVLRQLSEACLRFIQASFTCRSR